MAEKNCETPWSGELVFWSTIRSTICEIWNSSATTQLGKVTMRLNICDYYKKPANTSYNACKYLLLGLWLWREQWWIKIKSVIWINHAFISQFGKYMKDSKRWSSESLSQIIRLLRRKSHPLVSAWAMPIWTCGMANKPMAYTHYE